MLISWFMNVYPHITLVFFHCSDVNMWTNKQKHNFYVKWIFGRRTNPDENQRKSGDFLWQLFRVRMFFSFWKHFLYELYMICIDLCANYSTICGIWMSPQLPLLDLSGHLRCCLCGMAPQGFSKPQLSSSGMATPLTDQYQGQYTIAALQMGSAEAQSWKICLENSENLYFKCKESSLNMCETVKKNRFLSVDHNQIHKRCSESKTLFCDPGQIYIYIYIFFVSVFLHGRCGFASIGCHHRPLLQWHRASTDSWQRSRARIPIRRTGWPGEILKGCFLRYWHFV